MLTGSQQQNDCITITEFDQLTKEKKKVLLEQCCGSSAWTNKMLDCLPVGNLSELLDLAEEKWYECNRNDWLEAFEHHPMIGDINSLKKKYASTLTLGHPRTIRRKFCDGKVLKELAETNKAYKNKFGYIFIVCAYRKISGTNAAINHATDNERYRKQK